MERIYDGGTFKEVDFFVGTEIEHTPALGLRTLFVVGIKNATLIGKLAEQHGCQHIYLGANQSFDPGNWEDGGSPESDAWGAMIHQVLELGHPTTLDFDVRHVEWVCEGGYSEKNNFIPQISVKIPHVQLLGYNATLKIDDRDFDASNPGVWCHQVHDLMDRRRFTAWSQYGKDTPI